MSEEKETIEVKPISEPLSNLKHEMFCQYYVNNSILFGNATHSYNEAYKYNLDDLPDDDEVYDNDKKSKTYGKKLEKSTYDKAYNVCSVEGARLLRSPKINARITVLLNELLTDDIVDGQLAKVIMQDKDIAPKVQAIKAYNDIRGRVIKRTDLTTDGDKIQGVVVLPAKE